MSGSGAFHSSPVDVYPLRGMTSNPRLESSVRALQTKLNQRCPPADRGALGQLRALFNMATLDRAVDFLIFRIDSNLIDEEDLPLTNQVLHLAGNVQVALEYHRTELIEARYQREQAKKISQDEINRRLSERALAQKQYQIEPPEGYVRFKQLQKIGELLDDIKTAQA